jgi:N-acetylmuramoyl-L-alanine amidase
LIALTTWVVTGCRTAPVENVTLTEVALSETRPFALPSAVADTEPARLAPPPTSSQPPAQTNLTLSTCPPPPATGWVSLESWSQDHSLGRPQKIALETYAVTTPRGKTIVQPGSQCVRWEGVNVWLGFAPRYLKGQPHLHALDVSKTFQPLLDRSRPAVSSRRVVVIDPGHGGADGGTVGNRQQLEKTFALDWALRVQSLLLSNGWEVHLTRTNDVDVSLAERIALADHVQADLFVSLHFNGLSADSRHGGVEAFCTTPVGLPSSIKRNGEDNPALEWPNNRFDAENLQCAFHLQREILAATQATDGGVRHARFMTVLRGQRRPAVLVEGGFLSNPEEARRIATGAYRQQLARAVARALEQFYSRS